MTLHHLKESLPERPPQPRRRKKQTRLYLDLEYITEEYLASLPRSATVIYLVLAKYANFTTQTCFPSIDTLMKESGIKNRTTAIAAVRILEAHRIIAVQKRSRRSNLYTLLDSSCWVRSVESQQSPECNGK